MDNISSPSWSPGIAIATVVLLLLSYAFASRETSPLRKIPGPFLASLSTLWIVRQTRKLKRHEFDRELHEKYGPVVRIAPDEVLCCSREAFKTIYSAGSKFTKGDFYLATGDSGFRGPDQLFLMAETNMEKYRLQRRLMGGAYTVDAVKMIEPNMDLIMDKNIRIMRQRAGQSVDMDTYLQLFASDCLQTATYGTSKGLVEGGEDDGSIAGTRSAWQYIYTAGYFPFFHKVSNWFSIVVVGKLETFLPLALIRWFKNPRERRRTGGRGVFAWHLQQLKARLALESRPENPTDIAGKLLKIQTEKEQLEGKVHWVSNMLGTNFGAGVETIGGTFSFLVNSLITYPECQERVHRELDEAKKSGKLSEIPKMREMRESLPYLSACLRESMRLHNVIGAPMVRKVPEGGREIDGYFLPAGTTVGINPWAFGRSKELYGEDAEIWRPERWLEYTPEKAKSLETYSLSWGAGARSCPGKHLATAIYSKLFPLLLLNFEFSYTNADLEAEKSLHTTFVTHFADVKLQWKVRDIVQE